MMVTHPATPTGAIPVIPGELTAPLSHLENPMNEKPLYHFLVTALLVIHADDSLGEVTLNAVLKTEKAEINAGDLARAQQIAQMLYFNKIASNGGDTSKVEVKDVVLLNISPLGLQSQEEFIAHIDKKEIQ